MGDQQAGDSASPPSEPPIIPLGPWCIAKIKRKLHEHRTERKKETAQDRSSRRTATATGWIAFLAFVTAGIGALQYFTFRAQLGVMQGQLSEMHTASVLTMTQLRADIELLSFTPKLMPNGDWQIQVIWHNHGSTNANEFEQWTSFGVYAPDVSADFDFSKPTTVVARHAMTLAGTAHVNSEPVTIVASNIQVVTSGQAKLYVWGDALYKDVFFPISEIHHTHYCSNVLIPDAKNPGVATFDANKPECNYAK